MAAKTHPYTARISYDADGADPYTALTDVKMITPPKLERGDMEITWLESANQTKEFQAGWIDPGEPSFDAYMTKAQLAALMTIFNAGTTYYWRIAFALLTGETNNSKWEFQGHIKSVETGDVSTDNDDAITCTFTIKVTGRPTFTQGS